MSKNGTRSVNTWIRSSVFCCLALFSPSLSGAAEIKVTLFQQPCLLSGPFDASVLTAIHSISPEKMPPEQVSEQLRNTLESVRGIKKPLPPPVEQYRDHLKKRLMATIAFSDSISAARKKSNIDLFLANIREHVFESKVKNFEASMRSMAEKTSTPWSTAFVDQLKTHYENVIQPHPEEEFHRAIHISQIRYTCAFDEVPGSDEEEDDDESPLPVAAKPAAAPAAAKPSPKASVSAKKTG